MAVPEGFEPSVRYKRTHAFQACALSHSATAPKRVIKGHRPLKSCETLPLHLKKCKNVHENKKN